MPNEGRLDVASLLRRSPGGVLLTWSLVLLENLLMAFIPLFIGRAIDGLMGGNAGALWPIGSVLVSLILVAVVRRAFDTRSYGTMRVQLGGELVHRSRDLGVSQVNARLEMARELVDFLEQQLPALLTGMVQLLVSVAVLFGFGIRLGLAALVALLLMALIYAAFHRRFFIANQRLNEQWERQVAVLEGRRPSAVKVHLEALRRWEIRLSDTEALLYGLVFLVMSGFVLTNLVGAAGVPGATAGTIFAIVSYSWEFVESAFQLPVTLQQWTRLSEITERINGEGTADGTPP